MNFKILIVGVCVLALVVAIGSYFFINSQKSNTVNNNANTQQDKESFEGQTITQNESASITLTTSGFEPNSVKVKPGTEVVWINDSGKDATVNSDPHPTHFLWPFLNLGNFADGENLSTVFEKPGVYTYHNHFSPEQKGTVTVE